MSHFHVIMPVGSDGLASQKLQIVEEVASSFGLEAILPSYDFSTQNHVEIIASRIRSSLFGIADLTGSRPSCYYELGISEALGKRMYLMAQNGSEIHQTSNRESVRYYFDLVTYKEILQKIVKSALAESATS